MLQQNEEKENEVQELTSINLPIDDITAFRYVVRQIC